MGLWQRFSLIFKSKADRALDAAEDPRETLDYSYEQQLRQLQNVKRGIADVTTAKKRLELQYSSMQQQVDKLAGQARDALTADREDLAREALTRKAAIEGQLGAIMQTGFTSDARKFSLREGGKDYKQKELVRDLAALRGEIRAVDARPDERDGEDARFVGRTREAVEDEVAEGVGDESEKHSRSGTENHGEESEPSFSSAK